MAESDAEEQAKQTDLLRKKISTIEYSALELCANVIDSYQQKLEKYKKNIENLEQEGIDKNVNELWQSLWPTCSDDHIGLCKSASTLNFLLGKQCLPYGWTYPRTLETAMQNAGLDAQDITAETKRCEEYLKKTDDLSNQYSALSLDAMKMVYNVLTKKERIGKTLTSEEQTLLNKVGNSLAEDH